MGQTISIPEEYCVEVPEGFLEKDYTVKRTSGQMESGWRIPRECYVDRLDLDAPSASKHARSDSKGLENWRIFMDNGPKSPEEYAHGWRRISTVYPTELDGDEEAIEEWRKKTIELLEQLEVARVTAGGKTPEEEFRLRQREAGEAMIEAADRIQRDEDARIAAQARFAADRAGHIQPVLDLQD
jgi:hypothetical protein